LNDKKGIETDWVLEVSPLLLLLVNSGSFIHHRRLEESPHEVHLSFF